MACFSILLHRTNRASVWLLVAFLLVSSSGCQREPVYEISGELKQWHRATITFRGPKTSETADPNPFLDYRLNVTFHHLESGKTYVVPGFYAADGNAHETLASEGDRWRVHFTPDSEGIWEFTASFRRGKNVALSLAEGAGEPTSFDGARGQFTVGPSDKTGRDFRAQGRLAYVGEHYFQFLGSRRFFIKGGADSPENFLAYADFDQTYDPEESFDGGRRQAPLFVHTFAPHLGDWREGDPTWQGGKGKGIIGALNYLASKGMNSVYFLTYNIDGGDGKDTWMWIDPSVRDRYDVSKLAQWEIVFSHMDRLGIMLHVVTQETENDRKLGGSPGLNPIRKLYYRELVARFAHHLGVVWNLGEENNTSDEDRKQIARYIRALDPYDHPITFHTHNNKAPDFYNGVLGDPYFEAASIQAQIEDYNWVTQELRRRTAQAGRKWVICGDEQPPARDGVVPDAEDPDHDRPRIYALWGNLMAGGGGVEWYFGYDHPHNDLTAEDWRSRDRMWDQTRYALEFFHQYLPFWEMEPDNSLARGGRNVYVFHKPGEVYAVYVPFGGQIELNLPVGIYTVHWYNPRTGGKFQTGTVREVRGGRWVSIGQPPRERNRDWVALVRLKPA